MSDNLPAKPDPPLVRYWDHNYNEVFPPDDFAHITVDQAGIRWSGLVTGRYKLKNGTDPAPGWLREQIDRSTRRLGQVPEWARPKLIERKNR